MAKLKLGIIGAGRIGKLHAENLKHNDQVELIAVSDLFVDSLEEWTQKIGFQYATKNYDEIIDDENVDAIFVCSPTSTHAEIIEKAAKNSKHIFCEKPISFSLEETRRILKVVDECKVKFQVGFNRRYDHNFRSVKEALSRQEIGNLHSVKVTSRDPEVPPIDYIKKSGGLFFDMTIHDYDMIRYIVGSEPTKIYAQGHCHIDPEVEKVGDIDTAMCMINFENNAIAIIDNSRQSSYGYDQRIEVFGDHGSISTENDTDHTLKISNQQGVSQGKPKHFFLERYKEAYIDEVAEFIDGVLNDKPISTTGEDGYRAELLAHAANRSLQEQRPVELSEFTFHEYQQ